MEILTDVAMLAASEALVGTMTSQVRKPDPETSGPMTVCGVISDWRHDISGPEPESRDFGPYDGAWCYF